MYLLYKKTDQIMWNLFHKSYAYLKNIWGCTIYVFFREIKSIHASLWHVGFYWESRWSLSNPSFWVVTMNVVKKRQMIREVKHSCWDHIGENSPCKCKRKLSVVCLNRIYGTFVQCSELCYLALFLFLNLDIPVKIFSLSKRNS